MEGFLKGLAFRRTELKEQLNIQSHKIRGIYPLTDGD